MDALAVSHVSKRFGDAEIIHDLSFTVAANRVVGFLGPNGAGKTTTLRMLVGLSKPSAGDIVMRGNPVKFGANQTLESVGYVPELPSFYPWMTASEYLDMTAGLYRIADVAARRDALLKRVGLYDARNKRIGSYSGGMVQRLGIAQALVHEPEIVILDEPMASLDPLGRKEVLEIIEGMRHQKTVLFSTHILSDVDRICDDVLILNKGRLIAQAPLAELKRSYAQPIVTVELAGEAPLLDLMKMPWQKRVEVTGNQVKIWLNDAGVADQNAPLRYFAAQAVAVLHYGYSMPDTEDLFVDMLQKDNRKERHA